MRTPVIGVMGGHVATPETEALAEELGAAIARKGWILLNGARNEGIMAASARGASREGGFVVGVHPGHRESMDVAPHLDLVIFSSIGFARNAINAQSSSVLIALPGGAGTLNEVAFAETFRVPTILLHFDDKGWFGDRVRRAGSIEEAIRMTEDLLERM